MFVLTDKKSGGIYSVLNRDDHKTVQCFEEEDDCRRYLELLIANGTEHELLVLEVEDETIEISCGSHGYDNHRHNMVSGLFLHLLPGTLGGDLRQT